MFRAKPFKAMVTRRIRASSAKTSASPEETKLPKYDTRQPRVLPRRYRKFPQWKRAEIGAGGVTQGRCMIRLLPNQNHCAFLEISARRIGSPALLFFSLPLPLWAPQRYIPSCEVAGHVLRGAQAPYQLIMSTGRKQETRQEREGAA